MDDGDPDASLGPSAGAWPTQRSERCSDGRTLQKRSVSKERSSRIDAICRAQQKGAAAQSCTQGAKTACRLPRRASARGDNGLCRVNAVSCVACCRRDDRLPLVRCLRHAMAPCQPEWTWQSPRRDDRLQPGRCPGEC